MLCFFLKTCPKKEKDPINPKLYDTKPKKNKETKYEEKENPKSYVGKAPDSYEAETDAMEKYGSAKDLFAHAFSFGKRNRH